MGYRITEREKKEIATKIQEFIDANKPHLKLVDVRDLAPAIINRATKQPYNIKDEVELSRFRTYAQRLQKWGILRHRQEEVRGPRRYSVNPEYLDKTGVLSPILIVPPATGPVVTGPHDDEKVRSQAISFIEEEMKKVQLELAVVHYAGANLEMTEVNLYQLYKIAMSIDNVCEKISTPILSDTPASHSEQNDDSEEETEGGQFEFDQTETEDGEIGERQAILI